MSGKTHRMATGIKLYAVSDKKGRFKDIQTYKRANEKDMSSGKLPLMVKRCPMIPAKYKRATCWKRCKYWNRKEKRCEVEVKK